MEPLYSAVVYLAIAFMKVMGWKIRVSGAQHIPERGGAVIAANHVGFLDFVFIGYSAWPRGRKVRFMALESAFRHPIGGPLMRGMKHIPVDRYGDANPALHAAVGALRRGEVVGIHPDSRISRTFLPGPAKTGAARMAIAAGVPLIPCAVWGSQRLWTHGHRDIRRGVAITVDFGPPITPEPGEDATALTARVVGEVRRLVDLAISNYPQVPRGPSDRWWLPQDPGDLPMGPDPNDSSLP